VLLNAVIRLPCLTLIDLQSQIELSLHFSWNDTGTGYDSFDLPSDTDTYN